MANIIGLNPEDWAKDQVDLRQQLLGLKDRDAEVLSWMNSKTAWIRAVSSVSITAEKSEELTNSVEYAGRALAKEFVLFNGVTSTNNENLNPLQKSGISSSNSIINSNVYGFGGIGYNGIVPMPGIEKLDIQTYSRGSLRKAKLKIKAFNREQFAILDTLYMRPGYTVLLEWGHTSYFTGRPENYTYTQAKFDTPPFANLMNQTLNDSSEGAEYFTQDDLLLQVNKHREDTDGNYDGFFGKITNFDWKFNDDGTYDITISAISTGDVIDSLTINRTLPTFSTPKSKITPPKKYRSDKGYVYLKVDRGPNHKGQDYEVRVRGSQVQKYKEYWKCKGNEGYDALKDAAANPDLYWGKTRVGTENLNAEGRSYTTYQTVTTYKSDAPSQLPRHYERMKNGVRGFGQETSETFLKFTLKPPANTIAEPTSVAPDTLLVQRDKTDMNKWLYDIYNTLQSSAQKESLPTTKAGSEGIKSPTKVKVSKINGNDAVMLFSKATVEVTSGITGDVIGATTVASKNAPYQYVTLRNLFDYIQNNLLLYNKDKTPYINIDFETDNYCYTFPEQFSSDPLVCVIPFRTRDANNPELISGVYWEEILGTDFKTESDFVGKLMNIHVNIHYIASVLDKATKNNSVVLLDFLKNLMHGIQVALGSVNKFSVIYSHDENTIKITDDVPLDPKIVGTKIPEEKRTLLNVYGYDKVNQNGSFISDVGISATLSNAFATMISIGAQSRSTSDISNSTAFSKWNKGLQDVVFPSKLSKAIIEKDVEDNKSPFEVFKDNIASLKKSGNVIKDFYYNAKEPAEEAIASTKSLNAELAKYLGTYYNKDFNVPSIQGFIPFNMNLKMQGFSGFKIYEKFYITTEILPPSYPDNLSFIIKGLRHSIDDRGWQTAIESLSVQSVDGESILEVPQNVIDSLKS